MKKVFMTIFVLILAVGIGGGAGLVIKKTTGEKEPEEPSFAWGVQAGVYTMNLPHTGSNEAATQEKIKYLKKLGVNTVRLNLESTITVNPDFHITYNEEDNDKYIDALYQNGFNIFLILDPYIPPRTRDFNRQEEGYAIGKYAGSRYAGKVKYFQTANEVTGTIAKPADVNFKGKTFSDEYSLEYSTEKYQETLAWVKGMQKGLRETAPKSKIVLSGHWVLFEVIRKMIHDGADFDILGWAWYDVDGLDTSAREAPDGKSSVDLAQRLNELKKDIWIVESNRKDGSLHSEGQSKSQAEQEQADFISKFTAHVANSGKFKGYFAFMLSDESPVASAKPNEARWGLTEIKKGANIYSVAREKPAFSAYQSVIENWTTASQAQ